MKKAFYEGGSEKSDALKAEYNPRYNILTVAFIYKFDL